MRGCLLRHKNITYPLPIVDQFQRPFGNADIALLSWDWFKGKCPQIGFAWNLEYNIPKDSSLMFVGSDPGSGQPVIGALGSYDVNASKIRYSVSSQNGSCGNAIIASHSGRFAIVGLHGGTTGTSSPHPNYALRFNPKN